MDSFSPKSSCEGGGEVKTYPYGESGEAGRSAPGGASSWYPWFSWGIGLRQAIEVGVELRADAIDGGEAFFERRDL